MIRKLRSLASALGALAAASPAVTAMVVAPPSAGAQSNPLQRGPNPTATSVLGNGPYSISSANVSAIGAGFGGGTIYYPTTTSDGDFGGVVIAPGFTAGSTSYLSLARRVLVRCWAMLRDGTPWRPDPDPAPAAT